MKVLKRLEIVREVRVEDGWMKLARRTLRNHYDDGTTSVDYAADSAWRVGIDAVAVLPWRRRGPGPEGLSVLLRECLRPGLDLRARLDPPTPDAWRPLPILWEMAAGIPEADEYGLPHFARCAARELAEEMGLHLPEASVLPLGAAFYPSGGILTEMIHPYAACVPEGLEPSEGSGDGTPFEEVGGVRWWTLPEALAACRTGEIADAKTEIALWRLAAGWAA